MRNNTIIKASTLTRVYTNKEAKNLGSTAYSSCIRVYPCSVAFDRLTLQIRSKGAVTVSGEKERIAYSYATMELEQAEELWKVLGEWITEQRSESMIQGHTVQELAQELVEKLRRELVQLVDIG